MPSATEKIIEEAEEYSKNDNDVIVTTHITSPFIKRSHFLDASEKLKNNEFVHSLLGFIMLFFVSVAQDHHSKQTSKQKAHHKLNKTEQRTTNNRKANNATTSKTKQIKNKINQPIDLII